MSESYPQPVGVFAGHVDGVTFIDTKGYCVKHDYSVLRYYPTWFRALSIPMLIESFHFYVKFRCIESIKCKKLFSFSNKKNSNVLICTGDARYLISNSKDQSIKLWDLRKCSTQTAAQATKNAVARQGWDYRWQRVPRSG